MGQEGCVEMALEPDQLLEENIIRRSSTPIRKRRPTNLGLNPLLIKGYYVFSFQ